MIGSATSKRTKRTKPITGAPSLEISPATEVIANNVDLLTEILLCLPAKSLIRFKSVSKHWFFLISNSQFSITHSRRNPNPSISSWFFCSMPHEHLIRLKINHSCNGLLLIEYVSTTKHYFMVYNPTIQKYALIPEPTAYSDWYNRRMLRAYLDFDPSKSSHYKVVLLSYYYHHNFNVGIYVYCSGSTCWKQIRAPRNRQELRHAAFFGGVFYWFNVENMLVGFDVDLEKMIEMPKAPKIQRADRIQYFGGCGGRLILILNHMIVKILEMDKNDVSWKIDCEVDLRLMSAFHHQTTPYWNYYSSVLSLVKKEEGKGYELTVAFPRVIFPGKVITYNLSYIMEFKVWSVVREVVPGESICDIPPNTIVHPYIESLSPV